MTVTEQRHAEHADNTVGQTLSTFGSQSRFHEVHVVPATILHKSSDEEEAHMPAAPLGTAVMFLLRRSLLQRRAHMSRGTRASSVSNFASRSAVPCCSIRAAKGLVLKQLIPEAAQLFGYVLARKLIVENSPR